MVERKIGGYKIVSELGRGGMGIVYKAFSPKLDRFVAIKVLKSTQNLLEIVHRFKKEAKNQAKLSHANVVPIYDFIEEEGNLAIVMEYVQGETLEQLIERRGKLDAKETLFIFKQVLSGISFAHSSGFIHRDVKPSNILLSHHGHVKIMDFGISKSVHEKNFSSTGKHAGTLLYMSPEQIKGEDPTVCSDIYSLGITLYEMLTGKPPFDFNTEYQVSDAHVNKNPRELSNNLSAISPLLQSLIFKALEKKPSERFSSAQEFLNEIEKIEKEVIGYKGKTQKRSFRYKAKAILYTSVIILGGIGLFYFIFMQVLIQWKNGNENFLFSSELFDNIREVKDTNPLKVSTVSSGTNETLYSVHFVNDTLAFCAGSAGVLLRSGNGGTSWSPVSINDSVIFYDIYFHKNGKGFLGGENSTLYQTYDYGKAWSKISLPYDFSIFKIYFINEKTGFITGSKGSILKTINAGLTWYRSNCKDKDVIYDLDFINNRKGFAVSRSGKILFTTDAGENWNIEKNVPQSENSVSNYIKSIDFYDEENGFAVGGNGSVFYTHDGGDTWSIYKSSVTNGLYNIVFFGSEKGLITGSRGKILYTTDAGKTWTLNDLGNVSSLNQIAVNRYNEILIAGANGNIRKFTF